MTGNESKTSGIGGKSLYETISYTPSYETTNDLEAATSTITATSEASGVGSADYSSALTFTVPDDARLEILRMTIRLSVTIDSLNAGCAHLYGRVYVDIQDADHRLFDVDLAAASNHLSVQDCLSGTKEDIFDLLKDGSAHTFYFFFWVDAGNAVLSVVQLWEAVGTCQTLGVGYEYLKCAHQGWFNAAVTFSRIGSIGNATHRVSNTFDSAYYGIHSIPLLGTGLAQSYAVGTDAIADILTSFSYYGLQFDGYCAATDIGIITRVFVMLRSN